MNVTEASSLNIDYSLDSHLSKLTHYGLYPQMMPLIGSHYRRMNKQVLVIGESHYLHKGCKIHLNAEEWYRGLTASKMQLFDEGWINTRMTAGSGVNQYYGAKAFTIYRNIEYALREVFDGEEWPRDNYFRYAAFYNYFQRPAETGVSIENDEVDDSHAYQHLGELTKILEPTHLAFVSKRAYSAFLRKQTEGDFSEQTIFATAHPACSWWNREHRHYFNEQVEKMTSRDWFIRGVGELCVSLPE